MIKTKYIKNNTSNIHCKISVKQEKVNKYNKNRGIHLVEF